MTPEEATQVDFDPFDVSEYTMCFLVNAKKRLLMSLSTLSSLSQDLAPWSIPHAGGRSLDPQQEPRR